MRELTSLKKLKLEEAKPFLDISRQKTRIETLFFTEKIH